MSTIPIPEQAIAAAYSFMGSRAIVKATSDQTSGSYCVLELHGVKGDQPPLHVHERDDEGFYVIDGALRLHVGADTLCLGPGGCAVAPRGVPHTYVVESQHACRPFDNQLVELRRIWAGDHRAPARGVGPATTKSAGPDLLVAGERRYAVDRAARYGEGWILAPPAVDVNSMARGVRELERAWTHYRRTGRPRITALFHFCLGAGAGARAERHLHDYYRWLGPDRASAVASSAATIPAAGQATVDALFSSGATEVVALPCHAAVEQVVLVADALRGFLDRAPVATTKHGPEKS